MEGGSGFLDLTVRQWLDGLGADLPSPGGGSAAAIAAAMGAALVAMAARLSRGSWPEAGGIVAQAQALGDRLAELAQADADIYAASLATLAHAGTIAADRRDYELGTALERAAVPPLAIAERAYDVVLLGAATAERCEPKVRPDAEAGVALAAASAQAAARLVEINLSATKDDPRVTRARATAAAAERAMREFFPPG